MYMDQAIQQYGLRVGLPNLVLTPGQHIRMRVGERQVGIEPLDRQLLIAITEASSHRAAQHWLDACRQAHADAITQWPLQIAMSTATGMPAVMAVVRLDESDLDGARIERAIAFLADWLSRQSWT